MPEMVEKAAVLRIIFDSVGKPATEIYQKVRELPGVEKRTGEWIAHGGKLYCSVCNRATRLIYHYCPDCGTRMERRKPGGQEA